MSYFSEWFDSSGWPLKEPPPDCIADCSSQGRVDDAVDYWVKELSFEAPAWLLRRYLKAFGAWDRSELCDHQQNLQRLLWTWCCDIKEASADKAGPVLLYLADH